MTALTDWLDQAKARADAATDGPWSTTFGPRENPRVWGPDDDETEPIAILRARSFLDPADAVSTADFIAAARTDLPKALDALRAVLDLADEWQARDPSGLAHITVRRSIAAALGVTP